MNAIDTSHPSELTRPEVKDSQEGEAQQRKPQVRYSYTNPPPDLLSAKTHLDKLDFDIAYIEKDLHEKSEGDFSSDAEYEDWYFRASEALKMTEKEKRFVAGWLYRHEPILVHREERSRAAEALIGIAQDFVNTSDRQIDELLETQTNSFQEIEQLKKIACQIIKEYQDFLPVLHEQGERLGVTVADDKMARKIVTTVIEKISRGHGLFDQRIRILKKREQRLCAGIELRLDPTYVHPDAVKMFTVGNFGSLGVHLEASPLRMLIWLIDELSRQGILETLMSRFDETKRKKLDVVIKYVSLSRKRFSKQLNQWSS